MFRSAFGQALIFEPEDVQAGFVAADNVVACKFAPATVGVFFRPGGFALMTIFRVITGDKIL